MNETEKLFIDLIKVALGKSVTLKRNPSRAEWMAMLTIAQKQAIVGFLIVALERLTSCDQIPPKDILLEWIGIAEQVKKQNIITNRRCEELYKEIREGGFRSCVLKGQGVALHFENPEYRQCGDIDIWVEGSRDEVLAFVKKIGVNVGHVDIKHSDMDFFDDVPVEVHFIPSWMYSPIKNKHLQKFFQFSADKQFGNKDSKAGFTHTTIDFDLVYSLVHIYRHVFEEGIGLRQLLDYYHILNHSTKEQRVEAFKIIMSLQLVSFAGGVMYVLKECFELEEEMFLCVINERHGKYLLSEILIAGNFGHFDKRYTFYSKEKRFQNGMAQLRRNLRNLQYYPSEVLWSPFWKIWHWCWRKQKGYL